jgi:hypothetical protein
MPMLAQHGIDPVEDEVVHLALADERDLPKLPIGLRSHSKG